MTIDLSDENTCRATDSCDCPCCAPWPYCDGQGVLPMTTYEAPPPGLVADSIRTVENAVALKIAVTDARTAAAQADPDVLRAVLADLDRMDIHLDVSLQHHFSPELTCFRCRRLLGPDAVVGFPGGQRERFCSHLCRTQSTSGGVL